MSKRRLITCPLCSGAVLVTYDNFEKHAIVPMTCFACEDVGEIIVERSERVYEPAERWQGAHRILTSAELRGLKAASWDIAAAAIAEAQEDGWDWISGLLCPPLQA